MPSEENQKRQRLKVRGALRLRQKIKKTVEAKGPLSSRSVSLEAKGKRR